MRIKLQSFRREKRFTRKMAQGNQKNDGKKLTCYADFVQDVPTIIVNHRRYVSYERLQFLGSGSFGKCFEVEKISTKQRYACKILSKAMVQDVDYRRLVQNEIRIHRKLNHEHVVQFIQSFDDNNFVYIVQSLCTNRSLRTLKLKRGVVSLDECRYFISQILKGAQYIHDSNVIHRDLKLSNILIDENMQIKIGDFGLAIRCNDPRLQSNAICGTTHYLAPEVIRRRGFDCRSDIWAIGVIAYILMFGAKPFEGMDVEHIHELIKTAKYSVPPNVDGEFKKFLRHTLEIQVEFRLGAKHCLKLDFFKKHAIPIALPVEAFESESCSEQMNQSPSCIMDMNFSRMIEMSMKVIDYPVITVDSGNFILKSIRNAQHIDQLKRCFDRFDAFWRYHADEDCSISDLSDLSDFQIDYWVDKWAFDTGMEHGFIYQLADGVIGVLFVDGTHYIKTPDNKNYHKEPHADYFSSKQQNMDPHRLQVFEKFQEKLEQHGQFIPWTEFSRSKMVPLYTWFQTKEAMVMLLSNGTLQINFTNHKKVLINMEQEVIAFTTGQLRGDFKIVPFSTLATHGLSAQNFEMFKYVTALVKHLAAELEVANLQL